MDDKLFNDIEKEIKEENSIDLAFPIEEEKKGNQNMISLIIAVLTGVLLACIVFSLLLKGKKEGAKKEIPVFEKYEEDFKQDVSREVKEVDASIYNSTRSFDEEAEALAEKQEEVKAKQMKADLERKKIEAEKARILKEKVEREKLADLIKKQEAEIRKLKAERTSKTSDVKKLQEVKEIKTIELKAKTSDSWSVQLLSGSSAAKVESQWQQYQRAYPSILGGQEHEIQEALINGKKFYRLRVSNLSDRISAKQLCEKLKSNKISCFVTK